MKTSISSKGITKRVKYLLNSVNIPFELAKVLKWRQLYRLLKKAQVLDVRLNVSKKELKQLARDIINAKFEVNKNSSFTKVFEIKMKNESKENEQHFFVPFIKPFISFFQDEFPLLLI